MSVSLLPMDAADYDDWLAVIVPEYAADKVTAGTWLPEQALRQARESIAELLPQGSDTPGHYMFTLTTGKEGRKVGFMWFGRRDDQTAYLYDIFIQPDCRRRGYGRQAMGGLESAAATLGFRAIALHVFGHNHAAATLYRSLGYEVTDLNLRKLISPEA